MSTIDRPSPAPAAAVSGKSTHSRWPAWLALALVAGLVGIIVWRLQAVRAGGRRQMPPVSVAAVVAEKGDLRVFLTGLGTVTPLNTVTVRSRAVGELRKIHFAEGQLVQAGDLLAEIDPRAYEVALEQAEGQLARDQAQLQNARLDLARYQGAEAAVTQQQLDTAKAAVAQLEGTVRADQGAVDNDRLQLSYCRITAPLTGRAGLKLVDEGNLIQSSDTTGIVVLTQEEPISVVFSLPEDNLPQVRGALAAGRSLPVRVFDRSQKSHLATGTLAAIDNQIDPLTGTVKLRALFTNEDHGLFPNQFVNVRLLIATEQGVTLIPNSAIQIGAQTNSIFVIQSDDTVQRRTVKLGRTEGERTAIVEGLVPGEVVAADSIDKLQDKAKVIRNGAAGAGRATPAAPGEHPRKERGAGAWPRRDAAPKTTP